LMKTLCIVHVFYPDFWPEIASCLRNVEDPMDLVVTYVDETKGIPEMVRRDFPSAKFLLCENRGFDIWPFLKALQAVNLQDYSVLIKLHTKRDVKRDGRPLVFNNCDFSENAWRDYLLGFIHDAAAWRSAKARLELPNVGMVADRHVILRRDDTPWFKTRRTMDLAISLVRDLYGVPVRHGAQFVAGTMFAARPSVFVKLMSRKWTADDFTESVHDDTEQKAHVLERALGIAVTAEGLRIDSFDGHLGLWRVAMAVRGFLLSVLEFLWSDSGQTSERRIIKVFGISVYRSGHRLGLPEEENCVVVEPPSDPLSYSDLLNAYALRETARHAGRIVRVIGDKPCTLSPFGWNPLRRIRSRRFLKKFLKPVVGKVPKGAERADMGPNPVRLAKVDSCWLNLASSRADDCKTLFVHFKKRSKENVSAARAFAKAHLAKVKFFFDDSGCGGPIQYVDAVVNSTWVMTDTELGVDFATAFGKDIVAPHSQGGIHAG